MKYCLILSVIAIDGRAVQERQEDVDTIHDLPLNLSARGYIISKPVGGAEQLVVWDTSRFSQATSLQYSTVSRHPTRRIRLSVLSQIRAWLLTDLIVAGFLTGRQ
jgi:hypothetical protein